MPKYLVETVSIFRIRYVVEAKNAEDAKDEVVMQDAEEFGQLHVDENIIGCREVSDDEIPVLFFEDAPYLQDWGPERAMKQVHVIKYEDE